MGRLVVLALLAACVTEPQPKLSVTAYNCEDEVCVREQPLTSPPSLVVSTKARYRGFQAAKWTWTWNGPIVVIAGDTTYSEREQWFITEPERDSVRLVWNFTNALKTAYKLVVVVGLESDSLTLDFSL